MNPKLPLDGHIYTCTHCRWRPNHQCISNQSGPAFVQSYSQSQARPMFVTALGMDNFDCTKMQAHFTACLREGLIHEWKQAGITSPTSPPYVPKQLTVLSVPHTSTLQHTLLQRSINDILRILVKAQPGRHSKHRATVTY